MKTFLRSALAFSLLVNLGAVEWQPFKAQITRALEALDYQGANLPPDDLRAIRDALEKGATDQDVGKVESLLDKHALIEVNINPESRVKVARGKAVAELAQSGWRAFLIKVVNEAGVTAELRAFSPQGKSVFEGRGFRNASESRFGRSPRKAERLWLDLEMFTNNRSIKSERARARVSHHQNNSRDPGKPKRN